jgi:hypothetical protein
MRTTHDNDHIFTDHGVVVTPFGMGIDELAAPCIRRAPTESETRLT